MKVLFCGLGSMGSRHLRNLQHIMKERQENLECHALRSSQRRLSQQLEESLNKEFLSWDNVDSNYDCIFITNPTSMHYETLEQAVLYSKRIFIEKPVFFSGQEDLSQIKITPEHICYVAAPLRYTEIVRYLKQYLQNKNVFSVRAMCSSYLPEWRPGTDWRKCYSANKDMGGGVDIDLIHEWDYLTYLFGLPQQVYSIHGRYGDVTVDSCDNAVYVGSYPKMSVSLHLDYFGRVARRELEIFMEDDVLIADFIKGTIKFLKSGECIDVAQERDVMQCAEMEYFLSLKNEQENDNNLAHAMEVLRLARGTKA